MNTRLCAVIAVLAVAAVAWSQDQPAREGAKDRPREAQPRPPREGDRGAEPGFGMRPPAGPPRGDAMMENFFPPELVMRHQKEIGLTADQRTAIREEMQKTVAKFTDLQWQQSDEEEAMQALLKEAHPDEKAVLAQLDKLMAVENDLKRTQLGNLVRIKNILTPEQQAKLTEFKRKMEPRMRDMEGMPPQPPFDRRGVPEGGPKKDRRGPPEGGVPPKEGHPVTERGAKDMPSAGGASRDPG